MPMRGQSLSVPDVAQDLLLPLIQAISFYNFVETLSGHLGENADAPEGLNKVTATV